MAKKKAASKKVKAEAKTLADEFLFKYKEQTDRASQEIRDHLKELTDLKAKWTVKHNSFCRIIDQEREEILKLLEMYNQLNEIRMLSKLIELNRERAGAQQGADRILAGSM